jgi:predicted transcriptional regulator
MTQAAERLATRYARSYVRTGYRDVSLGRTDMVTSEIAVGRAAMPMTAGWAQYHPGERPVSVIDIDGKVRWITPKQYAVYQAVLTLKERASMARIASSLGYATSTVSRALLRLASLGLLAYDVAKGRYGGIVILKATREAAQRAWEKLKAYRIKREARWYERLTRSGYPTLRPYVEWDATLTPCTAEDVPWDAPY